MKTHETLESKLGDIPPKILEQIISTITDFSVLIIFDEETHGSGTLIKCADKYGILTAYHVVNKLPQNTLGSKDKLRLVLDNRGPKLFSTPVETLKYEVIGNPVLPEKGPDLAFIEIPKGEPLGTLKSIKSFYDIESHRRSKLEYTENDGDLWAFFFSPKEYRKVIDSKNNYYRIKYAGFIVYTEPLKRYKEFGFDFVEVGVKRGENNVAPDHFGGSSGGGLWKIRLEVRGLKYENSKPTLAGVLFYQTPYKNGECRIRCHGPKSIYEVLYKKLSAIKPNSGESK